MRNIVNFIFEAYHLKQIPRSGSQTFGSSLGSIAEHTYLTCILGLIMAIEQKANIEKTVLMCLLHDLVETRTGDGNFIHKRYQVLFEDEAISDQLKNLDEPLKNKLKEVLDEYQQHASLEALIVREADILEQLVSEKVASERGNQQAKSWMDYSFTQLKSPFSKKIGKQLLSTNSFEWWHEIGQKPTKK